MSCPTPPNEADRLEALHSLAILDTPADRSFDAITEAAADCFGVPICLVSLIDAERQWFKARVGLDCQETPRDLAFCAHTVAADELLVVPDASSDSRFARNPLVAGEPHIRFYAGCPIRSPEGHVLGALCIKDRRPRDMSDGEVRQLRRFATLVEQQLCLHKAVIELKMRSEVERRLTKRLARQTEALKKQTYLFNLASKHEKLGVAELDLSSRQIVWSAGMYDLYEVGKDFDTTVDNVLSSFFSGVVREASPLCQFKGDGLQRAVPS